MKVTGRWTWLGLALAPLALRAILPAEQKALAPSGPRDWGKSVSPFLTKFCAPCHQGPAAPGGVRLAGVDAASATSQRALFDRVGARLKEKTMPPPGALQPTAAQRDAALLAIQRTFAKAPPEVADPGRVTMRRLNRSEYDRTVRDLLGIDLTLSSDFPADEVGDGFDNIGDVLTLPPLLFEKYLDAAEAAAAKAIVLPEVRTLRFPASQMETDNGASDRAGVLGLFSGAFGAVRVRAPKSGQYRLRIRAYEQHAGPDYSRMAVRLDGKEVQVFEVRALEAGPGTYELPLELRAGESRISAHFVNDYYEPRHADPKMRGDRNLFLVSFEVFGPVGGADSRPESHRRLLTAVPEGRDPLPAARENLKPFLRRAFRRPTTDAEVERFAKLVLAATKEGEPFEQGMRLTVAAALVSPHFLFRVELDGPKATGTRTRALTPHELASRLSYFLWGTMPDAELFRLADEGRLSDPGVLEAQALRMLRDPKASALTEDFATQWLTLRKLESVSPDPGLFPSYSERLQRDMAEETKRFFAEIVAGDRSVVEFLDAPYSFLNGRLATLYGIAGVSGESFRRVPLADGRRGGLLTMASVLTVTSNPNRTSPVKRGKWVLENILGEPPPPPPPGLDSLEGDKDKTPAKTIKERMARHRKDPSCAVCHAKMDPLGLAFENYDPIGRWRTKDGKFAVDATGLTPDGTKLSGALDIKRLLVKQKRRFVRTLAEKLMTYGLGRGIQLSDRKGIDAIAERCLSEGSRFSALVKGIVSSEAFRKKRV